MPSLCPKSQETETTETELQPKPPSTNTTTKDHHQKQKIHPSPSSSGTILNPHEHAHPTTIHEVKSHLEWVIQPVTQSINDRSFTNTSTPCWDYIAEDFRVQVATGYRPTSGSKAGLIEDFKNVIAKYPDFELGLPRCVTEADWDQGVGRTFAYATETGGPQVTDLLRKHITVFTSARDLEGRWILHSQNTMLGEIVKS